VADRNSSTSVPLLRKQTCIDCVNKHDSRGWGYENPNYEKDHNKHTAKTMFTHRWIASDDTLWGDECGKRRHQQEDGDVVTESGIVVCPHEVKEGYSYDKHGDLGVVQEEPPVWCPYPNDHMPMVRFRELANEDDSICECSDE